MISTLSGSQSPSVGMAPLPPAVVLSPPAAPVGPQELKHKVVDLTEETKPEDDLQRAIALSLQDGGNTTANAATSSQTVSGVSQEEQDVSKALEASLLETTRGRKKKEEQNPHDRERDGEVSQILKKCLRDEYISLVFSSATETLSPYVKRVFANLIVAQNVVRKQADFCSPNTL